MSNQATKYNTILLVAGVLFIIWGVLGLMDSKNYAYSGYGTDGDNTIVQVRVDSPAEAAGMQVGDVITSYDGIASSDSKAFSERKRTEIGQVVPIEVERGGEAQTLEVTYSALPSKNSTLNMASFIMGLLFVLLALYVHNRKKSALSISFAAFAVCFGYIWFNGPNIEPGFLSNLVNSINVTIVMYSFVALSRFILRYPPESSIMTSNKKRMLYVPAAIIVAIIWVLNFAQPDSTSTLNVTIRLLFGGIIIFYFGLAVVTLIRKYSKASAEVRTSSGLNMMLMGAVLGILPFLIYYAIGTVSPATILPGNDYIFLTFALIPIFFTMALLKQRKV